MNTRWAFVLMLLLAGCGGKATRILVSVESTRGVSGIDHLVVGLVNAGQIAVPFAVAPSVKPFNVAPGSPFTFSVQLDAARSGSVEVDVAALDADGHTLIAGSAHVLLVPGDTATVSVLLGATPPDAGMGDGALPVDAARPDAAMADLAPPDLATDDGAIADLAPPDLATDDGAIADLAPPDVAMPDLALPDLALPDLATADLTGAPSISSITPSTGASAGGTKITILGAGFQITPTVTVDGVAAPMVMWNSANKLSVTTPPSGGSCGLVDVVVTNPNALSASARLFTYSCLSFTAANQALSAIPAAAAIGDLDVDGKPDLVFAVAQGINQLLPFGGIGNDLFAAKAVVSTGSGPYFVAIGDMNGDGNPDLVAPNYFDHTMQTYLGDKGFNFAAQTASAPFGITDPLHVAIADFDKDGKLDVAFSAYQGAAGVLHGDGAGGFGTVEKATSANSNGVVSADFDGDGYPDIALADRCKVSVLLNSKNGKATFPNGLVPTGYVADRDPYDLAAGDLDGDGKIDLVVANIGLTNNCGMCGCAGAGNDVSVLLGAGGGAFKPAVSYPVGVNPIGVTIADWNGDGIPDLATGDQADQTVSVLLGSGDGTFQPAESFATGMKSPVWIGSGQLDGDTKPDIVLAGGDASYTILANHSK